ncbi:MULTISPECIES: cytochrome P450 [unclassified Streptomyces]|uniref:cytochrome P450 n=1 Tax=unclassified Streptomyces TaxID=2593676 RepID=UPI00336AD58A
MSQNDPAVRLPLSTAGPLDPPPEWETLRAQCPVADVGLPSGDTGTLLTRYDHIRTLLSDSRISRPTAEDNSARIAPEGRGGVSTNSDMELSIQANGEGHQKWRRHVGRYFTAKRMTALRPGMKEMAESLVDAMVKSGAPADLKAALGFPLPVYVICDLLGAPAEDRDRFSYWSDAFLNVSRYSLDETRAAHRDFSAYMTALVQAERAEPGEDLISTLIEESRAEGQGLTDPELRDTGMALLVAGHETTANMIGKMITMLLADRTRWETLLADPSLVRTAVEEVLRSDTNLGGFGVRRYLPEDFEIDGTILPRGTTVFCALSSANRDERAFADPDQMDLTRSPNPHLTFGAGAHSCLGQSLARTELQVALEVLLDRLPSLDLAVPVADLQKVEGLSVGGLREVPVRW